jgi:hypothetical protein
MKNVDKNKHKLMADGSTQCHSNETIASFISVRQNENATVIHIVVINVHRVFAFYLAFLQVSECHRCHRVLPTAPNDKKDHKSHSHQNNKHTQRFVVTLPLSAFAGELNAIRLAVPPKPSDKLNLSEMLRIVSEKGNDFAGSGVRTESGDWNNAFEFATPVVSSTCQVRGEITADGAMREEGMKTLPSKSFDSSRRPEPTKLVIKTCEETVSSKVRR